VYARVAPEDARATGARIPDGETSFTTTSKGVYNFYLGRGETFACVTILSPSQADQGHIEVGVNHNPAKGLATHHSTKIEGGVTKDVYSSVNGEYNTPFRPKGVQLLTPENPTGVPVAMSAYSTRIEATADNALGQTLVLHHQSSRSSGTMDTKLDLWPDALNLNPSVDGLPATGTSAAYDVEPFSCVVRTGSEVHSSRELALGHTWSDKDKASQSTTHKSGSAIDATGTTILPSHTHATSEETDHADNIYSVIDKIECQYSPYIIVAVASKGFKYTRSESSGGVISWTLTSGTNEAQPAPPMCPRDIWSGYLEKPIDANTSMLFSITRHWVPMIGGVFSNLRYLDGHTKKRLVGGKMTVQAGDTPNNAAFCSLSLIDPDDSFLPRHTPNMRVPEGWDTPFDSMPMTRLGSRTSERKALSLVCTTDPDTLTDWKTCTVALGAKDSKKQTFGQVCSTCIGMVNSLSDSIAQSPVLMRISSSAHWETKALSLIPQSRNSHVAPLVTTALEKTLVKTHQTMVTSVSKQPEHSYAKLFSSAGKFVVDDIVKPLLPVARQALINSFTGGAGAAEDLGMLAIMDVD